MTILGRNSDSTPGTGKQNLRLSGSGYPLTTDAPCRGPRSTRARGYFALTVAGLTIAFALGHGHANWSRRRFIQSLFTDADLSSFVEEPQ
ncbi:hypothetical protein [Sphingomonas sp. PP-CC-3A-396]|uniref:hypothetical protein n=1 Tax=Sphingomonas sp. PP-CC-3A-396 TaxID=2135655 RepID=UPI001045FA7F|nr:hypothetical protein [Sphingomonas sp. PP-CC-3A-396]TCQ04089.1 hypothetical protein C8J40_109224 [Sphingomonas sp. PP-CC-3A-396]